MTFNAALVEDRMQFLTVTFLIGSGVCVMLQYNDHYWRVRMRMTGVKEGSAHRQMASSPVEMFDDSIKIWELST